MHKLAILALGAALISASATYADPGNGTGNAENQPAGGKEYVLVDGTTHSNPGEMFQHLRDRSGPYAAGNAKEIVEAYPNSFDNVGDLIQQKKAD